MLELFRRILSPRPSPIGVDFGSESLRLAQVQFDGCDFQLIAAASAAVPASIRNDLPARVLFYSQTVRDLLAQGKFRGRQAVLGLPSAWTIVRSFQMDTVDESAVEQTFNQQPDILKEKMLIRHIVAGQANDGEKRRSEVITLATRRSQVDSLLDIASGAGLDVTGLTAETLAMVHCFGHIYRRKSDAASTTCFVDIGAAGTRLIVARGKRILHMRSIPIGGDALNAAVGAAFNMTSDDARLLRQKLTHADTPEVSTGATMRLLKEDDLAGRVELALREPLEMLLMELQTARQYHNKTFPSVPVERLIFCGGEARSRWVTKFLASNIDLPTQIGDPMVRLAKSLQSGMDVGIDRRQSQPSWAAALGLTMGPPKVAAESPVVLQPAATTRLRAREAA